MTKEKMMRYARLVVNVGINPNKGQKLMINCPVECADFGRMCVEAAYKAGCGEVIMNWTDDFCARQKYLYADDSVFETYPEWQKVYYTDYAKLGTARLSIYASDPENLKGVDPKRIATFQKVAGEALAEFRTMQMKNDFPWCVVSIPVASWATKIYPDLDEESAQEKLWDDILKTVRADTDEDPVERWRIHLAKLDERRTKLNNYNFKYLKYKNSLGTDLTVALPEGHIWEAGSENAGTGQSFVPNMPTEEIFTAPHRLGINGTICASKPLVLDGNIIENIKFVIKDGKIVDASSDTCVDVLKNAISVDEGASYFGEVALVPFASPISDTGILFYNTLFDENASCHFAFGDAYPTLKGASEMTAEQLFEAGLNSSMTHEDFMIGTSDLSIVGITHEGEEVPVFVDGNFAF